MPLAIKTPDDYPSSVEISEVGEAGPNGTRPVRLSALAAIDVALQDESGAPLPEKELEAAAKEWVAGRPLEVKNVRESAFPQFGIDIREFAADPEAAAAAPTEAAPEQATEPEAATEPAEAPPADGTQQTPPAAAGNTKGKTA